MINYFILIFAGSVKVKVPAPFAKEVLNFLIFEKLRFFDQSANSDGDLVFTLFLPHLKRFRAFCKKLECPYELSKTKGIPRLFEKYKKRWGVYVGLILFCLIVWQSTRYVWYIDVSGNKTVPASEIISNLEALGFTYGTEFKKTDFDVLHNRYLARFDDLCWISVNMEGTWAHVEVRELLDLEAEKNDVIKNIVASEPGTVVLVEAFEGKPMVSPGDKVAAGDLLLSGVISVRDETVRFECSDGVVLAEVERNFTVTVPKFKEKKLYTGQISERKELIFFKKHVKLSGNYGISYVNYDTIEETKQICLFNDVLLPVFVRCDRAAEYTLLREELSENEFEAEKKRLTSSALKETLAGAELLEMTTYSEDSQDALVLHCGIICLADIAKPVYLGALPE